MHGSLSRFALCALCIIVIEWAQYAYFVRLSVTGGPSYHNEPSFVHGSLSSACPHRRQLTMVVVFNAAPSSSEIRRLVDTTLPSWLDAGPILKAIVVVCQSPRCGDLFAGLDQITQVNGRRVELISVTDGGIRRESISPLVTSDAVLLAGGNTLPSFNRSRLPDLCTVVGETLQQPTGQGRSIFRHELLRPMSTSPGFLRIFFALGQTSLLLHGHKTSCLFEPVERWNWIEKRRPEFGELPPGLIYFSTEEDEEERMRQVPLTTWQAKWLAAYDARYHCDQPISQDSTSAKRSTLEQMPSISCWIRGGTRCPTGGPGFSRASSATVNRLWASLFPMFPIPTATITSSAARDSFSANLAVQIYASANGNRTLDFAECLARNVQLHVFDTVLVLVDRSNDGDQWPCPVLSTVLEAWSGEAASEHHHDHRRRSRVRVVHVHERPSVGTFLRQLAELPQPDAVNVIANNDVYFDGRRGRLHDWLAFHYRNWRVFSAITRRNHSAPDQLPLRMQSDGWLFSADDLEEIWSNGAREQSRAHWSVPSPLLPTVPNAYSSDVWAARRWPTSSSALDLVVPGEYFADTLLHGLARAAGLRVVNPCVDVFVYHLQSTQSISESIEPRAKQQALEKATRLHGSAWLAAGAVFWSTLDDVIAFEHVPPPDPRSSLNGRRRLARAGYVTGKAVLEEFVRQPNWINRRASERVQFSPVYIANASWQEISELKARVCNHLRAQGCFFYPLYDFLK